MGSVLDRLPTKRLTKTGKSGEIEADIEEELDSDSQMSTARMLVMVGQALYFYRKGRKVDSLLLLAAVFIAPRSGRLAFLVNTLVTLNTLRKYLKSEKK